MPNLLASFEAMPVPVCSHQEESPVTVTALSASVSMLRYYCRRAGSDGARPRGVWEIMDSLRDISPDDLFPGVAYSISEDDGDEDMPYTRPVRPTLKEAPGDRQRDDQDGSDRRRPEGVTRTHALAAAVRRKSGLHSSSPADILDAVARLIFTDVLLAIRRPKPRGMC